MLQPDLDDHLIFSETMFGSWRIPAHPGFFFLIQLLSGFTRNYEAEIFASFIIFSASLLGKIYFSRAIIEEVFRYKVGYVSLAFLLGSQLIISFSVFQPGFIIHQISPNYFHNGTLLLSHPFALALLLQAYRFNQDPDNNSLMKFLGLGILISLIKPSFLFCFIPVFPLYTFINHGMSRKLLISIQTSILFTFIIIIQSFYLKNFPPAYLKSFRVAFMPFLFFGDWKNHLFMIFNGSYLAIVFAFLYSKVLKSNFFVFLILMQLVGYLISILFVDLMASNEPGSVEMLFPNMTWQTSISLYFFLVYIIGFIFNPSQVDAKWKRNILVFLFSANFVYSCVYLFYALVFHSFFI